MQIRKILAILVLFALPRAAASAVSFEAYYNCYMQISMYTGFANTAWSPTPDYVIGPYSVQMPNGSLSRSIIVLPGEKLAGAEGLVLVSGPTAYFVKSEFPEGQTKNLEIQFPKPFAKMNSIKLGITRPSGNKRWLFEDKEKAEGAYHPVAAVGLEAHQVYDILSRDIVKRIDTAYEDYQWREKQFRGTRLWSPSHYIKQLQECKQLEMPAVDEAVRVQVDKLARVPEPTPSPVVPTQGPCPSGLTARGDYLVGFRPQHVPVTLVGAIPTENPNACYYRVSGFFSYLPVFRWSCTVEANGFRCIDKSYQCPADANTGIAEDLRDKGWANVGSDKTRAKFKAAKISKISLIRSLLQCEYEDSTAEIMRIRD